MSAPIDVGAGGATAPDLALPPALALTGRIGFQGAPVEGALVQVSCWGTACVDPGLTLAETITAADGSYRVALPDPGR